MASRNIPLVTIQTARRLGEQALDNYHQRMLLAWVAEHARDTSTEQSFLDGYNVAYDLRRIPRYVVLYFDGKDANDMDATRIVAMEAYNLSDNMMSAAFRTSLWRTFKPFIDDDDLSSDNNAITLSQRSQAQYNAAHNREERAAVRTVLSRRGYKRMMQFIFNNNGTVSRII